MQHPPLRARYPCSTLRPPQCRGLYSRQPRRRLFLQLDPNVLALTDTRVGGLRGPVGDFKDIARTSRAIKLDDPHFSDGDYRHRATARGVIR